MDGVKHVEPMSEGELSKLSSETLRGMLKKLGITPEGGKGWCVRRILAYQRPETPPALPVAPAALPEAAAGVPAKAAEPRQSKAKREPEPRLEPVLQPGGDRFLDVAEAARMIGIGERKMWELLSAGVLSRIKPCGKKRTCVSYLELQQYLAYCRAEAERQCEQMRRRFSARQAAITGGADYAAA